MAHTADYGTIVIYTKDISVLQNTTILLVA